MRKTIKRSLFLFLWFVLFLYLSTPAAAKKENGYKSDNTSCDLYKELRRYQATLSLSAHILMIVQLLMPLV